MITFTEISSLLLPPYPLIPDLDIAASLGIWSLLQWRRIARQSSENAGVEFAFDEIKTINNNEKKSRRGRCLQSYHGWQFPLSNRLFRHMAISCCPSLRL